MENSNARPRFSDPKKKNKSAAPTAWNIDMNRQKREIFLRELYITGNRLFGFFPLYHLISSASIIDVNKS